MKPVTLAVRALAPSAALVVPFGATRQKTPHLDREIGEVTDLGRAQH